MESNLASMLGEKSHERMSEVIEQFRVDELDKGGSFDSAIAKLRHLNLLGVPTFRAEIEAQKYMWSNIILFDRVQFYVNLIKKAQRERLEELPKKQMETIGASLIVIQKYKAIDALIFLAGLREEALCQILSNNFEGAELTLVHITLLIQSLDTPIEDMIACHDSAESLNEFLDKFPHLRAGFDTVNRPGSNMIEYIEEVVDAHVDLVMIGMRDTVDGRVDWYCIAKKVSIKRLVERYASAKGIISIKYITLKYNGRVLFLNQLSRTPSQLGIKDYDLISVSIRQPTLPKERAPLKQLHCDNSTSQTKRGKTNGNRKKSTIYVPPEDEKEKLRQQHSKAMSRVLEEAEQKFDSIRKKLNDMNLQRMPPKDRSRLSKSAKIEAQSHDTILDIDAPKAGKAHFVVRVGDASNLYKTAKPTTNNHGNNILFDLHGLTKDQALAKLDKSLPGWMNLAMKESYPFVIQVKIVCGGGSQILAGAVENWIKAQKNVAKAPKNHS